MYHENYRTAFLRVKSALAPNMSQVLCKRLLHLQHQTNNPDIDCVLRLQFHTSSRVRSRSYRMVRLIPTLLFRRKVCSQSFWSTSTTWVRSLQQVCCSGPVTLAMTTLLGAQQAPKVPKFDPLKDPSSVPKFDPFFRPFSKIRVETWAQTTIYSHRHTGAFLTSPTCSHLHNQAPAPRVPRRVPRAAFRAPRVTSVRRRGTHFDGSWQRSSRCDRTKGSWEGRRRLGTPKTQVWGGHGLHFRVHQVVFGLDPGSNLFRSVNQYFRTYIHIRFRSISSTALKSPILSSKRGWFSLSRHSDIRGAEKGCGGFVFLTYMAAGQNCLGVYFSFSQRNLDAP